MQLIACILDSYERVLGTGRSPLTEYMVSFRDFNVHVVSWIMREIPAYTFFEVLTDMLTMDNKFNVTAILDTVDVCSSLSNQQYSQLIDIGRQFKSTGKEVNENVFTFIFQKYRETLVSGEPEHEDEINGRCTKFECNCNPVLDPFGEVIDEDTPEECISHWYLGKCQVCNKKHQLKQSYRHRMDGGCWKGCYCSQECLNYDCLEYRKLNPLHCSCVVSK